MKKLVIVFIIVALIIISSGCNSENGNSENEDCRAKYIVTIELNGGKTLEYVVAGYSLYNKSLRLTLPDCSRISAVIGKNDTIFFKKIEK